MKFRGRPYKQSVFLLILCLATLCGHAQSRADMYREDLRYLVTTLPEKHIDPFTKISRSDFEKKAEGIASRIDTLGEETFFNELMMLVASVGDAHTMIANPGFNTYRLPVRFGAFQEGIFVTASALPGLMLARLAAINGVPVENVLERMTAIIADENASYIKLAQLYYLDNACLLKGLGIVESRMEIPCMFVTAAGDTVTAMLKPSPDADVKGAEQYSALLPYSQKGNYWYCYDPEHKLLYFNYRKCAEEPDRPFKEFNKELFGEVAKEKPEKLVVDLRYNGGGNSKILEPFLKRLKKSYLNKEGKLYVLIGMQTFSSALLNAVQLEQDFHTVLVGQPTSGNLCHFGEVRSFLLPNTEAVVSYSTKYFEMRKGCEGPLEPDVRVEYSIENLKQGRDEALQYIYDLR